MKKIGAVIVILGFFIIFPLFLPDYFLHIVILTLMYAFLAQAWNIMSGYSGQFSFGHAAFFGVGAYTSTILLVNYGISPWLGMLIGGVIAAIIALIIGFLSFRYKLKGAYFALGTLAFAEILRIIVKNTEFLKKSMGIVIPLNEDPVMYQFDTNLEYYYVILILTVIITVIVYLISRSRLGFNLIAIRENEDAAKSLGVKAFKNKMIAIAISGGLTALGGTFYAQYILFVEPSSTFGSNTSIAILIPTIIGGVGTVIGPIIGAIIIIPLGELTSALFNNLAGTNLIAYGVIIILIILYMPEGIVGRYNNWSNSKKAKKLKEGDHDSSENLKD